MATQGLSVKVGDEVVISTPRSKGRFATMVQRRAFVTAVRAKSFDAGGLCFRNDGREWCGRDRVDLVPQDEQGNAPDRLLAAEEAIRQDRAERAREDVTLAFLLSYRHQQEWLKLGVVELRRIAALHGIAARKAGVQPASDAIGQD